MTDKVKDVNEQMGILPPFEAFYIEALFWHTAAANSSIDVVSKWLKLVKADDPKALELSKTELFSQLQNIVQQAGAISRYFWPSKAGKGSMHKHRASQLRLSFGVVESNPLKQRELRNGLEHFDERLDVYLSQNLVGEFILEYVDYVKKSHEIPTHIFKAFYTFPKVFVLLDVSYEMAPLVNEVLRLHKLLKQCKDQGHRFPA